MQTNNHATTTPPDTDAPPAGNPVALGVYLLLSVLVLAYVGLLTGNRSEKIDADAWEHHRAVLAMSQNLWEPGNPTYATDEPTIRYSPYTFALAQLVRSTGIDAYDALSGAAVFNTLMLLIAVWWWLRAYGLPGAAPLVLLSILFLYGTPPGYANSLALSDLPWHQVNPSALAIPLMIFLWAWLYRAKGGAGLIGFIIVASLLLAFSVLSHGMSGVMGAFGMFITAIACDRGRAVKIVVTIVTCGIGFALAAAWPWYDFLFAVTKSPDKWYWFNPAVFKMMLLSWCLPGFLAALACLPMRDRPFIRTALLATAGLLCVTFVGALAGSPTLARLPLAGLIFPQAAVGVFIYVIGIAPRAWASRLRQLFDRDRAVMSRALVETTVVGLVVVLALPNFWLTLREPHLARKWVAQVTGREDKQPHNWSRYQALLTPHIGPGDVVLAEPSTGWPVPSFSGRVVAARHLEFFVPRQAQRLEDTQRFFEPATDRQARIVLLDKYGVKWLLLDRESMPAPVFDDLFMPDAVTADDGRLVLIDAGRWMQRSGDETKTQAIP